MAINTKHILPAWLLILLCCIVFIVMKFNVSTGLENFSLSDKNATSKISKLDSRNNLLSRLLIISLGNDQPSELAKSSKVLQQKLQSYSEFEFVANGQFRKIQQETDLVFQYRYLLTDRFDKQHMGREFLENTIQSLIPKTYSHMFAFNKERLLADPSNESRNIIKRILGNNRLKLNYGVWFDSTGKQAIIVAYFKTGLVTDDERLAAMNRIRHDMNGLNNVVAQDLSFNGPASFSVVSRDIIKREVMFMSITGTLFIFGLLYYSFRRKRIMLLVSLPVISGLIVAATSTLLVYGNIHAITLAFGITLLGITIDYPIHFISHLRQGMSAKDTVLKIWPVIRLGVITTLSGFVLMMFSGMNGLIQLGVFSFAGLIAAALTTRWVLPALVKDKSTIQQYGLVNLQHRPVVSYRTSIGLMVFVVAAVVVFLISQPNSIVATQLASLNPVPRQQLQEYEQLRQDIGLPQAFRYIAIRGDSSEAVLKEQERLVLSAEFKRDASTSNLFYAARYLPSVNLQSQRQQSLPDKQQLKKILYPLLSETPFKPEAFTDFITDVGQAKQNKALIIGNLGNSLLAPFVSSLLYKQDGQWTGLMFIDKPLSLDKDKQFFKPLFATSMIYQDVKQNAEQFFTEYRNKIVDRVYIVAAVIILVLLTGLKSMFQLLNVMLPIIVTLLLTILLILLVHGPLSIFHMVALILVFGISVDYSLFFNSDTKNENYRRIFHAIGVSALSTLAVFGLLAMSDIMVLKSIGLTVSIGTALAWLLSYFYSTSRVA